MTYCNLLFSHVQIKPDQQYKPCCRFDISKHEELLKYKTDNYTPKQVIMSEEWNVFRNKVLNSEKIKGCHKCYTEESNNVFSMRTGVNSTSIFTTEVKLKYIEVSFGNFCNLQCRSCTSDLSSSWYEEDLKLKPFYPDRNNPKTKVTYVTDKYNVEDYQHVTRVKFTGGEPILHPNFEKFIMFLVDNNLSKNITLDIFSNASWFPKNRLIEKLELFDKVILNLSIDGVGKVNDYTRYPSKWNIVEQTTKKWIETNFDVRWAPCLSVYNANNIIDMFEWWFKQEHKNIEVDNKLNITLTEVVFPYYLTPSLISNKKDLTNKLLEYAKSREFEEPLKIHFEHLINKVIKSINKPIDKKHLEEFLNFTADLDKLRKQNVHDYIEDFEYDFTDYGKM